MVCIGSYWASDLMGRIDSYSHWGCDGASLKEVERVTFVMLECSFFTQNIKEGLMLKSIKNDWRKRGSLKDCGIFVDICL